jgi:MFS family permease
MSVAAERAPSSNLSGWLVWATGAAFFGYAYFHRVAPSVMYDRLMAEFAATGALLGNLSASYFYAYCLSQIPIGLMLDRFGPRLLLPCSALLAAAGSAAFGQATTLEAACLGRFLVGLGTGTAFIGALALAAARLPARRFAFVTGLTQSLAMAAGVAAQTPLALIVGAVGWRASMTGFALLAVGFAIAFWFAARGAAAPAASHAARGGVRAVLTNRQSWLACAFASLLTAPIAFAVLWGVPWLVQAHGQTRTAAAFGASMVLLGWAAAAPFMGAFSERLCARKPIMQAGAAVALAAWLAALLWREAPYPALCALLFVVGAASSAMSLSFVAAREANPPGAAGFATGVANFCSMVMAALVQPLIGWLLDLQWDGVEAAGARVFPATAYFNAVLLFPAAAALGLLVALKLRETHPARRALRPPTPPQP